MPAEKVKRFLDEMRAVKGARYGWYHQRPGDTALPAKEPMYVRGEYPASYVKGHGVNCTGLGNQALGRMGLPIPEVRNNAWWTGGTPEWFDALKNKRKITEEEMERGFPVGTALISGYVDDDHQGHIVWVSTPKKNGKQLTIGSDDHGPGPGKPGVTEQRTVRDAVTVFGLTHAGETPGIGVVDRGEADDNADRVLDGDGGAGEDAGGFAVVDLREAMPGLSLQKARDYFPHLVAAMREADIATRPRACHFLAQLGHESGDLLHMQEIGDHDYFMRYEGRLDLGNTQPGDGPRYHGRGPIQLTGRANYRAAGRDLGLDLEANPERAADPDVAFRIAGWYWTTRDLNRFADVGDGGLRDVTRLINGGYNGLDDREKRYFNCKRVLPERFSIGGGEMSFERVVFAHATHRDGELAHVAAAIVHRHDVKCTVADGGNIKAAIAECQSEKVGWGDFVVIGKAAKDMFPEKLKPYIGETVKRSDYRDAVGKDLQETAEKLARVLDGIATRKNVQGDLRREFEDALGLVGAEPDSAQGGGRPSDGNGRSDAETGGGAEHVQSAKQGAETSNGHAKQREAADEGSVKQKAGSITEEDLEEIGREALELVATIRKLTGQGRF